MPGGHRSDKQVADQIRRSEIKSGDHQVRTWKSRHRTECDPSWHKRCCRWRERGRNWDCRGDLGVGGHNILLPVPLTGLADGFGREDRPTTEGLRGFTPLTLGSPVRDDHDSAGLPRPVWRREVDRTRRRQTLPVMAVGAKGSDANCEPGRLAGSTTLRSFGPTLPLRPIVTFSCRPATMSPTADPGGCVRKWAATPHCVTYSLRIGGAQTRAAARISS